MAKRPLLKDKNANPGLIGIGNMPNRAPVAGFNVGGIEDLITTKGFLGIHYKHAYNPNREELNGPSVPNQQAAHRGLIYYDPRVLYHVPRGYKMEDELTAQAVFGKGGVLINPSGQYQDDREDSQVHIRNHDLLVFPSLTDMTEQMFEYNPTGPQRLQYKVRGVDRLFDSERLYMQDRDFIVLDSGFIKWIDGGIRPDFKNSKGAVLSIVYYYTPIYIVTNLLHSLRVIPSNSIGSGAYPRDAVYAPQQVYCMPSNITEEKDLINWGDLPPMPDYAASKNTTGGSR